MAGGCQEDGLISVGLIEQPLGQKGGVVVGVVVEAVPDGRLGHPVFYAGKTTRYQQSHKMQFFSCLHRLQV